MKRKIDYRAKYLAEAKAWRSERALRERAEMKCAKLEGKLKIALDRLHNIASGFYPSDMDKSWGERDKLMLSAARTLRDLARME